MNISEVFSTKPEEVTDIEKLRALLNKLRSLHFLLQFDNAGLREEVAVLKKKLFGKSSEKKKRRKEAEPEERTLFNEAEAIASVEKEIAKLLEEIELKATNSTEVKAHSREKAGGRKPLPDNLERVEILHQLPESERSCHCGGKLEKIGEEITEKAALIPAKAYVERHIQEKYACDCCSKNLKRAEKPASAIPKSGVATNLLAVIVNAKYCLHMPLYRIEDQLKEHGLEFSRSNLAHWIIKLGELVRPLTDCLKKHILSQEVIHCDETTIQVLGERDKRPESKSYIWAISSGTFAPHAVYFEYHQNRSADSANKILEGFEGVLQCDGYGAYGCLKQKIVGRMPCMAHIRRKFHEAAESGSHKGKTSAEKFLEYIQKLYEIERECKEFEPKKRIDYRQTKAKPILLEFREQVEDLLPKVTPQSLLGKALCYAQKQLPEADIYLQNGLVALDNNRIENAIRPFCLGRKNWLFCQSELGAHASSRLYSLAVTAQRNGLKVRPYLEMVFDELARLRDDNNLTETNLIKLLPHNLAQANVASNS
jgi:transposase